ncbi:hypothetical protein [Metabacillus arenae]|uniref:Uncharacterized protein n=1 Tax=Metabacillus arenae TaxID=2771434 RepID=A0A926NE58_9BACI|nr:hypothetical protein [Metabacillus arenae]MBD1379185.1 hypothetical protein [Metabacillus arenae]
MTQLTLNISAKRLDKQTKYINPKQYNVLNSSRSIEKMSFLAKSLPKEAMQKRKEGKKFIRIATRTILTSISILTLVDPTLAFAATAVPVVTQTPNLITPPDIIKLCKYLLGICVVISFATAMIMSVIASSWGYFRRTNDAFKWVQEIIKSFIMMMLAPTLIITIALVAYMLFGTSDWFIKPF